MLPDTARRVCSAMVAAVRTAVACEHANTHQQSAPRLPALRPMSDRPTDAHAAHAQAQRVLSVPVVPGTHPLRALQTASGVAVPSLLAPAWAEVSGVADPVLARAGAMQAISMEWQWTPPPAAYAHLVVESGLLRQSTRLVSLGSAYVESLGGRCGVSSILVARGPWRGWVCGASTAHWLSVIAVRPPASF